MDILLYLLELIRIRKEIGINGLGTIYKKKSPGRYDAETHMFMPPSYTLAFTNELKENNYLSQHIVQKRNISVSAANYFINDFVEAIKKELTQGKSFELEGLGNFSLVNDEIQFTPLKDINFGFDFYALPPVDDVIKNENLDSTESENQVETHSENINVVEEHQTNVEQDGVFDEESTELNNIVEEVKFEEHNPGDDVNTDEVYEEIAEVDPKNIHQQTNLANDQWNFEGNNVADLNSPDQEDEISSPEEKINTETFIPTSNFTKSDLGDPKVENEIPKVKNWDFEDKEVEDEIFVDESNEEEYEEKKSIPLYLKFLIAILVILVVGAAAYFVNPGIFSAFVKNDNDPDQKIAMPIPESNLKNQTDSLSFADSISKNAQKAGLQVDAARDTIKVTTKATPLNAPTYEIVGAAFATRKEIDKYIGIMKRKGVVAKEIPAAPGKLMKKISLATYNNPDSAKKDLIKLKKQLKNPELYIFVNKPK